MTAHAPLPPSAAKRWMNCAGSYAATKDLPSTDTVYSREGTFAHAVAAELLLNDVDLASSKIGHTDGEFTVDAAMAGHIQTYLNAVRSVMLVKGGTLQVEQKVRISPNCWGTSDALIWPENLNELDVFDLKMGAGVFVAADGNEQLMIYALGALNERMKLPSSVELVHLHIVQPRYSGAEAHRTVSVTGHELREFAMKVADASMAAMKPDAPRTPGEWCRFCGAAPTCEALRGQAMQTAQDLFPQLDPTMKPIAPPLLGTLTVDQLAKMLPNLEVVEQWVKAIREHAFDRAKAGEAIPGWKLVEKIGNRKWKDEREAARTLTALGVDPWEKSLISPATADKTSKVVKAAVKELVERPVTGLSLVPESDERAPANPTDAFKVLP